MCFCRLAVLHPDAVVRLPAARCSIGVDRCRVVRTVCLQ